MSEYEYEGQTGINFSGLILNILTVVVLVVTLCLGSLFAVLLINPQSDLNPFKPVPLPTRISTWTPSPPAAQQLAPTWTPQPPTATREPTITNTPRPTPSPTPTVTPFLLLTQTPVSGTSEAASGMPYVLKEGSPLAIQNFAHADLGCNWMGVAGQAFDLTSAPITQGLTIELGGILLGSDVNFPLLSLTGLAPQYGPGGYEFTLANEPIASVGTLYIQLLDQAGLPLSDEIPFDTFDSCDKNLILINFQQVRQP